MLGKPNNHNKRNTIKVGSKGGPRAKKKKFVTRQKKKWTGGRGAKTKKDIRKGSTQGGYTGRLWTFW